jgi:hypothetical protein
MSAPLARPVASSAGAYIASSYQPFSQNLPLTTTSKWSDQ